MITPGFELVAAGIGSAIIMAMVIDVLFWSDEGREPEPRPLWRSCLEIAVGVLLIGAAACLLGGDPMGHLAGRSLELMAEVANGCGA